MAAINNILKLVVSILLPFAAAAIGGLATYDNVSTWYAGLVKPDFSPPNWVFAPVWTTLYLLMGISLYLIWASQHEGSKRSAFTWFGVQLALNTAWSLVFFGLHWPWGGVVVIVLLLAAIVMTLRAFGHISKPAAYSLVPYLLWVSFATILNIAVALSN